MKDDGYVYVLINTSMEGIVKIGKTERDPKDRAQELSSVTGVPTPFIVAYKAYFINCTEVEKFLHNKLQTKGYRVSNNREFFNAPLDEVVKCIVEAQSLFNSDKNLSQDIEYETRNNDDNNTNNTSNDKTLIDLADHYYLEGEYQKAFELYKKALDKGISDAYYNLGYLTYFGRGCIKDKEEAVEYFKEGAKCGDGRCYMELAYYYQNVSNKISEEWFKKYLESDISDYLKASNIFHYIVREYINSKNIDKLINEYKTSILNLKENIINYCIQMNEDNRKNEPKIYKSMGHIYTMIGRKIKELS